MVITRGYDRLVNLSDAVIAIAVTLLILPLVDEAGTLGAEPSAQFLADHREQLFLFTLSFAVISRFWLMHHQIYRSIDGYTLPLVWVNFVWLLSIVFLPFPTELLGQGKDVDNTTASLYIGTMLVTSASGLLQVYLIVRKPELQLESVRGTLRIAPSAVATAAMAGAFALAVLVPGIGVWPLLLLLITGLAENAVRRWRKSRRATKPASPQTGGH